MHSSPNDGRARLERVQFPLRALFVLTLVAGLVATVVRWLIGRGDTVILSTAILMGIVVGFGTVWIVHNVQVTGLLIALLIASAICGLWFSSRDIAYGSGLMIGGIVAQHGLTMLNAIFRFCGVAVSTIDGPANE